MDREFTVGDHIKSKQLRLRGKIVGQEWLKGKGWGWIIQVEHRRSALLKSVVRRDWEFDAPREQTGASDK